MVLQMQNIMYLPLPYQNSFTDLKLSSLIRLFNLPKLMVTTDLFTVFTSLSKAVVLLLSGTTLVAQMVKSLPAMRETCIRFLGWEDPLEKGMVIHSSVLAWRIPRSEEPGAWRVTVHGLQRVGRDCVTNTHTQYVAFSYWFVLLSNMHLMFIVSLDMLIAHFFLYGIIFSYVSIPQFVHSHIEGHLCF